MRSLIITAVAIASVTTAFAQEVRPVTFSPLEAQVIYDVLWLGKTRAPVDVKPVIDKLIEAAQPRPAEPPKPPEPKE